VLADFETALSAPTDLGSTTDFLSQNRKHFRTLSSTAPHVAVHALSSSASSSALDDLQRLHRRPPLPPLPSPLVHAAVHAVPSSHLAAISAMAQRTPDSPSLSTGSGSPSLPSRTSQFRRMLARLRKTVSHLSAAPRRREDAANVDRCLHVSSSTERKQHFKPSKHNKQGLDIDWIQGEELRDRVERKFQRYHLYRTDSSGSPWCAS
jgi:hypothetical protein